MEAGPIDLVDAQSQLRRRRHRRFEDLRHRLAEGLDAPVRHSDGTVFQASRKAFTSMQGRAAVPGGRPGPLFSGRGAGAQQSANALRARQI